MYKTIVVHIDGGAQQQSRLRAAALLAAEHGAHLVGSAATGATWFDYAALSGSMGAPAPDPAADFAALRKAARGRIDVFLREIARLGVESVEGRVIEDDVRHALLLQSRYADLVVLSQDEAPEARPAAQSGKPPPPPVRRLPEFVALRGTRPVLVVPRSYEHQALPGTVVAGWDGGMQALRAIGAALPLLRRAASVKLAVVNPDQMSTLHGEQPGADMALYLARHGVRVDVMLERTRTTAGNALMEMARDCGAGLMVIGAYGHSRYREWVLGGVTRELLERARIPLLLAH